MQTMICPHDCYDSLAAVLFGSFDRELLDGEDNVYIDIDMNGIWEVELVKKTRFSTSLESKVDYYDSDVERVKTQKQNIFCHWGEFVSGEEMDSSTRKNTYENISKDREYQIYKKQHQIKKISEVELERKKNWSKNAKPHAWLVTNMILTGNKQFYAFEDKDLFDCLDFINSMIYRIEQGETVILCWVQGIPAGPKNVIVLKKFRDALMNYIDDNVEDNLYD